MRLKDPEYLRSLGLIQLLGQLFSISVLPPNGEPTLLAYFCCAAAAREYSLVEAKGIDELLPMRWTRFDTTLPRVLSIRLLNLAWAVTSLTEDDTHGSTHQIPVSASVWPIDL